MQGKFYFSSAFRRGAFSRKEKMLAGFKMILSAYEVVVDKLTVFSRRNTE